ncbi:hypothetical protein QZH41_019192 [Actinostola sp. cb2023]|nr:hypothetical protein QZH41_019192 [Actinostola sp. cb2023]
MARTAWTIRVDFYERNLALFTHRSVKLSGKDEKIFKFEIANPSIREGAVLAANNEETSEYMVATPCIREGAVLAANKEETSKYMVANPSIREGDVLAANNEETTSASAVELQRNNETNNRGTISLHIPRIRFQRTFFGTLAEPSRTSDDKVRLIPESADLNHKVGRSPESADFIIAGSARFGSCSEEREVKAELATHVCQFVFLGNTGFRFPFAHWPTKEIPSSTLYDLFWKAVFELIKRGITIVYCCCDGGEANRNFLKIHFEGKDPVKENFTIVNPYTREPLIFIMDFSHNIKKLRNNLSKTWIFIKDEKSSCRTGVELNKDMLDLMKAYRNYLSSNARETVQYLDGAIEFLEMCSTLITNFTSHQYYMSMADSRLEENDRCLEWLQNWQHDVKEKKELRASERNKLFLSDKTMFEVASCILGFKALCKISFQAHPGCNVSAYRVNSDLVENVFCQQRGRNGQNDNPTYAQYGPTINSILLGQTTTTKKGNTGKVDQYAFYKPEKLPVKREKKPM